MKRVSFPVAKALKEAGYPQGETRQAYVNTYGEFYGELVNAWKFDKFKNLIDAPYVMAVWLWLWREKKIYIDIAKYYMSVEVCIYDKDYITIKNIEMDCVDPEEAVTTAIEHLCEENLIK